MNEEIIDVMVFAFPDGTAFWAKVGDYDADVVRERWIDFRSREQQNYDEEHGVSIGFVVVRMPAASYQIARAGMSGTVLEMLMRTVKAPA